MVTCEGQSVPVLSIVVQMSPRAYYLDCFSTGGISTELCALTDDGQQCAVEYNCVRWGSSDLPPQAGLTVFDRGADQLLAAVREYGDVVRP